MSLIACDYIPGRCSEQLAVAAFPDDLATGSVNSLPLPSTTTTTTTTTTTIAVITSVSTNPSFELYTHTYA